MRSMTMRGRLSPAPWISGAPSLQVQTVPEPGTWALMAAGLTTLLLARRRQR